MKQKLGLCCALIHKPDFLILDKPTTGVDPRSRRQFWELIESIRAERQRMSVLVSTAYMDDGLTQRFGDFTAVDDVSFQIEAREMFGFLGSNGCGKTTTMKMLTGLLPPTQGKAWLWGKEVDASDLTTRYRVGFMSQGFSLYGELTVQQNPQLHARLYHLSNSKTHEKIEDLVGRFGLTQYRSEKASSLPLGLRQRLSLAVAVIHEPEMLILDEPTSGVDPIARDQFWEFLIDLSRNQNVTIFISTHFMNEAMRCDRISLMHAGKVLVQDSPQGIASSHGGGV